ncbi:hypothetical protein Btru_057757 [Bulinus truncatus]|nr:hypothetical protein Btru_057757 [Bulinus truncatus]
MDSKSNGFKDVISINDSKLEKDVKKSCTDSFFCKLKNPHYKKNLLHSIWLALSLFSLGITVGQIGPSFLDLQIITNTNLEQASAFFTGSSIGYLTGSVISGAVYTKVNKPLLQFFALIILGISSTVTPYCSEYPLMIFIRTLVGICCGCIDTTGNAEHMRIWGNDGQVLMQLLHFTFAFGGVISPLYSEPFLAEKNYENNMMTNFTDKKDSSVNTSLTDITDITSANATSSVDFKLATNVYWAFLITGILTFLSSIPFLVLFFQDIKEKKKEVGEKAEKVTQRKLPKIFLFMTLVILCSFYMLYCCVEDTFASFLMTFLVKEYDYVSKSKALAGISMSAVFPAGFSWTEAELLRVTGPVSSCILVSASLVKLVSSDHRETEKNFKLGLLHIS